MLSFKGRKNTIIPRHILRLGVTYQSSGMFNDISLKEYIFLKKGMEGRREGEKEGKKKRQLYICD